MSLPCRDGRQIVLDASNGLLYWTQHSGAGATDQITGQIMVGNADGSGTPTELHAGAFGSVRGIAAAANLIPVELMGLSVD